MFGLPIFDKIHLDNFRVWCDAYVCKVYQRVAPFPFSLPPIVMVIGRLRAPPYYNKGNRPSPNPGTDKIIMIDEQTSS
jgi:hypothetical protein